MSPQLEILLAKKSEQTMLERLRKREERKKRQEEMEELAFNEWREKTPDEEIKKLVPPGILTPFQILRMAQVKEYFVKNEMEGFLKELS